MTNTDDRYDFDLPAKRHDNSRLSFQDRMVCELINIFQPDVTLDIYGGRLYINGDKI